MQKSRGFILSFVSCILLNTTLFAQKEGDKLPVSANADTAYIRSYADYLHVSLTYSTHNLQYRISDVHNTRFIFSPNEIYETDIGANYSFIDVTYSFSPRFMDINNNENIKGKTRRNSIAFGFSLKRFYARLEYCNVKGFYLHNTADFDDAWKPGNPYTLFPGMQVKQTGGQLTYNCNKRFSRVGLKYGDEQQLKTAYTLLPTLYVYYFKMMNGDTIIKRGEDEQTKNWDMYVSLPAAASFVFAKNWRCSVAAGPGIGLNLISSTLVNKALVIETEKQTVVSLGYTARLSLGWSNNKCYAGIDGNMRNYSHVHNGDDTMEKRFYNASIYAGIRFSAPAFLKRSFDWMRKMIPFDL